MNAAMAYGAPEGADNSRGAQLVAHGSAAVSLAGHHRATLPASKTCVE